MYRPMTTPRSGKKPPTMLHGALLARPAELCTAAESTASRLYHASQMEMFDFGSGTNLNRGEIPDILPPPPPSLSLSLSHHILAITEP